MEVTRNAMIKDKHLMRMHQKGNNAIALVEKLQAVFFR